MGAETKTRWRFAWTIVLGSVVFGALFIRAGIALNRASHTPENPLGLTGFDALAGSVVLTTVIVIVCVRVINGTLDRLLARMRQKFPNSPVFPTTVPWGTFELIHILDPAPKLKENAAAVVYLGEDEVSWWRGARSPKKLAIVRSDEPIRYRRGTIEYVGRDYPALIACVIVNGSAHKIPIFVVGELSRRFMLKGATDEELAAIEDRLQPQS